MSRGAGSRAAALGTLALWLCAVGLSCDSDPSGCKGTQYPERHGNRVSIAQGVWGDVWFWAGDFMPVCSSGTVSGVAREMQIYELTSTGQTEPAQGTFFRRVSTRRVASVIADRDGFFQVDLPPGRYSLFAKEDSLLYANGWDGQGNIYPVTVDSARVSETRFDINYKATY
jgi:hypothetical protein